MSTTETAIPAAPVAAEPAPAAQPTTPEPARTTPLRVDEIKARARDSVREAVSSARATPVPPADVAQPPATETTPVATVDANGRAHAPDGKFVPAEAGTEVPKPESKTTQGIRVEVPEGHWLRDQGVNEWFARDEAEARRMRGVLKDHSRRAEVSTLREQLIEAQARLRAAQETRESIVTDPDLLARIKELRSLGHDDMADLIVAGLDKKQADKVGEYAEAERQKFAEQDSTAVVQDFRDTTLETARGRYPDFWVNSPNFLQACKKALFLYANDVSFREQSGESVKLSQDGVWDYLDRLYLSDPEAQRIIRERKPRPLQPVVNDAAQRHATNTPLASVPSAVRTNHLSTAPAAFDKTGLSADQLKRELKARLFNRA